MVAGHSTWALLNSDSPPLSSSECPSRRCRAPRSPPPPFIVFAALPPPPPRHPLRAYSQIPSNKVKLMVGPGGEKIKEIQKKSKCRVQVGGWVSGAACVEWVWVGRLLPDLPRATATALLVRFLVAQHHSGMLPENTSPSKAFAMALAVCEPTFI